MTLRFANLAEFEEWNRNRRAGKHDQPQKEKPEARNPRSMNKTETAWAQRLEIQKRSGEILGYWYEAVKLRLADRTWYTPDFLVQHPDGSLEFQEIKGGHIWEDALVKFKVTREQYPMFRWSMWQRTKTQWARIY